MHGNPKYDAQASHLAYANPDAPKGGTLKMGAIGTFDTVNPYQIKGVAAQGLGFIYDRLMARTWDEPFTLYPLIAERAEIADDRSSVTFHLNEKAVFHDGTTITSDDVRFSFETLKEQGRPNMRRIYGLAKNIEQPDARTIRFEFDEGYDRETVMIFAMMPVLSEKWWKDRDFEETLLEAPLTNGPYRIKEINSPHSITYERVKDYWAEDFITNAGHNNFDTIIYEYYRDDTIALESFKKGDLDLRREFNISKWHNAYKDVDTSRITLLEAPHSRPEKIQGFIFNMRRKPFDDIRVRTALSLAFDGKWVVENLFHGDFKRITSFFPNSTLDGSGTVSDDTMAILVQHKENLQPAVFKVKLNEKDNRTSRKKLRKASDLLKEAGWIIENGKRVHKDTKQALTIEVILNTRQDEKIALNYSKTLEKLGIILIPRYLDSANFQNRKTSYDYDMLMHYWGNSLSPGTEQMIYWSCESVEKTAGFNYAGICNPALDDVAKHIADAKTYVELRNYAHALDRILLSEHIIIPLFYKGVDYIAYDKSIEKPDETALYGIVTETWWKRP